MKHLLRFALLATLGLACSGDGPTGAGCGGGASAMSVAVCDNRFAPAMSTIAAGATVMWTWGGNNTHNVTFDDGMGSSGNMATGTHSRAFPDPGSFTYSCTLHAGMNGTVTVQ